MKNFAPVFITCFLLVFLMACQPADKKQVIVDTTPFDETKETEAIMKVIEGETKCFFDGNYECWADHWSHSNFTVQAWNNSDGTADAAIGWESINAQGKGWIETYYKSGENIIHPEVKREKPIVKFFSDNAAYLIWKQYNADKEKTFFRISQESRLMEKEEGGWKIVNMSAFWDTQDKIPYDSLRVN